MRLRDSSSGRDGGLSPASMTSASLLEKVKQGDAVGWQRLMVLYRPLVLFWCRHRLARREDADDLVQEVLATVLSRVGEFEHQRPGSFRAWLKSITNFKLLEYWKAQNNEPLPAGGSEAKEFLDQFPEQLLDQSTGEQETSERRILLQSALELVRPEFEPKTWQAAMKAVEGSAAADVAAELGMSRSAVYIAKSRVLARLRKEMDELLD